MDNAATARPTLDKPYFENSWTEQLALTHLAPAEYRKWQQYRHAERLYMNVHGRITHWTRSNGNALRLLNLRLESVSVSPTGTSYELLGDNRKIYTVGRVPQLLDGISVFAWVPHFNEIRCTPWVWTDISSVPAVRVVLCTRQMSNPSKVTLDGHDYLATTQKFDTLWAKKSDNRS